MRPAFGPHFDSALIDPVEDAKLVCDAVMVGGVPSTEFEVREEGREIVLTLTSVSHVTSSLSPQGAQIIVAVTGRLPSSDRAHCWASWDGGKSPGHPQSISSDCHRAAGSPLTSSRDTKGSYQRRGGR